VLTDSRAEPSAVAEGRGIRQGREQADHRIGPEGIRADTGGELSLATATGGRLRPCVFTPSWWGLLANGSGADTVPAGGTLVQWALCSGRCSDHCPRIRSQSRSSSAATPNPCRLRSHLVDPSGSNTDQGSVDHQRWRNQ